MTCERDDLLYTLNKERWEANDAARVAGTEWHKALDRCRELESERDEAVHLLRTAQVERAAVADEHEAECGRLEGERDEARHWAARCWKQASRLYHCIALNCSSHVGGRVRPGMNALSSGFGALDWANAAVEALDDEL